MFFFFGIFQVPYQDYKDKKTKYDDEWKGSENFFSVSFEFIDCISGLRKKLLLIREVKISCQIG